MKEKKYKKICTVENCNEQVKAKGLCTRHHNQMSRYGRILPISRSCNLPNEIVDCGEYLEVILYNRLGEESSRAKIDKESLVLIENIKWGPSNGYATGKLNGKRVRMHKMVCGFKGECDHINRDKLDNRKSNLREVTRSQNLMNRGMQKNNSTGRKGVCFCKHKKKYKANIEVNGKRINLGSFEDIDSAAKAYDAAAIKLHKQFACTNNQYMV